MHPVARRALARLSRRVRPALSPAQLEVAMALAGRAGSGPAVLPGPPPGPVLCVAAHPDDEAIGCGGALARHVDAGDAVTVVVATSGEATAGGASVRGLGPAREAECRAALAALGVVRAPVFLRLPDQGLAAHVEVLASALRVHGADAAVVYVPSLLDPHPDHRAAAAAAALAGLEAEVLGTELWSPASVDVVLDVAAVYARKEQALRRYPIALESVDYVGASRALATYRGIAAGLGPDALAEGFLRLPAGRYREVVARAGT